MKVYMQTINTEELTHSCAHVTPFHRRQIKFVNVLSKLIWLPFKSTKDVHSIVYDAGGMTVTRRRYDAVHSRPWPKKCVGIETK